MSTDQRPLWVLDDAPIMGGAELFALRLCAWLLSTTPERDVRVLCPGDSELARRCQAEGVAVAAVAYPLPALGNTLACARTLVRLRRVLAGSAPDTLLVANSARAQAYAGLAWRSLSGQRGHVNLMHEQDSAQRLSARLALPRLGGLAAVGDSTAATYRAALPSTPIAQVTNFLPPREVHEIVAARVQGPAEDPPVVGVLSRMFAGKGVLELIDELADGRDAWSSVRIAAPFQDSGYTDAVRARIAARGLGDSVSLLGDVSDLEGFMASVDVVVVPSTGTEGQPTAILEALAYGRTVLVRPHVWARDYEGLAVLPFTGSKQLADVLRAPRAAPATAELLIERFDPGRVLDSLEQAARG